MLKLILKPILGSERPKRAKMSPKEPSGASKNQKPSFTKTSKTHWFFEGFWLQRPLKKASRGRRRLPKGTQKGTDASTQSSIHLRSHIEAFETILSKSNRDSSFIHEVLGSDAMPEIVSYAPNLHLERPAWQQYYD